MTTLYLIRGSCQQTISHMAKIVQLGLQAQNQSVGMITHRHFLTPEHCKLLDENKLSLPVLQQSHQDCLRFTKHYLDSGRSVIVYNPFPKLLHVKPYLDLVNAAANTIDLQIIECPLPVSRVIETSAALNWRASTPSQYLSLLA